MSIENFISATRRNIPERVDPEIYRNFHPLINFILRGKSEVTLTICYSPERRTELVSSGGKKYLVYDQYLGQTFSNISRIVYEADSAAFGFNYSCKILAEYFAMKSAFKEAALFARIHTVDDYKLSEIKKTTAPTLERLSSVLYQERFLCAHELVHDLGQRGDDIFGHAREVVELYFEHNALLKEGFLEVAAKQEVEVRDEDLEQRYPKLDDVSAELIEEMTCDMIALDLVAKTSEIYGPDQYPVAALGCFQALKSLQVISILRLAVEQYCEGGTDPRPLEVLHNDYQLRAGVLNWLCNNPELWCAEERRPIVKEIGTFLDQFHDNFATVAISLAGLVIDRKFEQQFHRDHEYLKGVFTERSMSESDILMLVDAMCGMPELTMASMFSDI